MLLPFFLYKINENAYFRKLGQKASLQWELRRETTKETDIALKTPVMDCKTGRSSKSEWELNQVELNSLRVEKTDILDYYGDVRLYFHN